MKVTREGHIRPVVSASYLLGADAGPWGTVPISNGSNGVAWGSNVSAITANGSNVMQGPWVNLAAGSNVILTLDQGPGGSSPSNTIRIHSIGSNSGGSSLTVADEGTPLSTAATTLDFVGSGVTASGTGATKTITIPGSAGGLTLPTIVQAASNASGVGTPAITIAQPATTSLLILAGANNGAGPTAVTTTNWTWTQRRNDGYGGVGDSWIWTGVYDGSGTPGTTVTTSGGGGLSGAMVIEVANAGFSAMGSGSRYAQTSTATKKVNDGYVLPQDTGSIIVGIVHTGGSGATAPAALSCPFVSTIDDSAQAISFGISLGMHVSLWYEGGGSKDYTLAEVRLT